MSLSAALGRYPHTEPAFADPAFDIAPFPTISRAFAPMVREGRFDLSEMALATFLMARAAGSDLVLLPLVMLARPQHGALLRRADDRFGPEALRGKRVGVRAYSQTTGLWLRGILGDEHGIAPEDVRWVTFEPAHVASYADPAFCQRAPDGADMTAMLEAGELDAAIYGAELPQGRPFAAVYPDPRSAAAAFRRHHGFDPVNHMLVVRPAVAQDEAALALIRDRLAPGNPYPADRAALAPALSLAIRYATEQRLLRRPLTLEEVWAGSPPSFG